MKKLTGPATQLLAFVFVALVGILSSWPPNAQETPIPKPNAEQEVDTSELLKYGANPQFDFNHPVTFAVRGGRLVLTICSERIVEIPFVHRHLPYPFRGRLLDVGYRESEIVYQAASLGFDTWGIDIRPPVHRYPGVHYITDDVCRYSFPSNFFDVVIALSTVEHIGLNIYGNRIADPNGDLHAVQAIAKMLKPNGRLILTVPFGRRGQTSWYRVYDHQRLLTLLKQAGLRLDTEEYWFQRAETLAWQPGSWKKVEQVDSVNGTDHVRGVACVVSRRRGRVQN